MKARWLAGGIAATAAIAMVIGTAVINHRSASVPDPRQINLSSDTVTEALNLPDSSRQEIAESLHDHWFTDGRVGYFLDAPGGPDDIVSLYSTLWWSRYSAAVHTKTPVDPAVVRQWLAPLTELNAKGSADTATEPDMALISDAVSLAHDLGLPISKEGVSTAVQRLLVNGMYRLDSTSVSGDWGSTAMAISVLRVVGAAIPESVTRAVLQQAKAAQEDRSPDAVTSAILPLLRASIELGMDPGEWSSTVAWIGSQLPTLSPDAQVSIVKQIRETNTAFGSLAVEPGTCEKLNASFSHSSSAPDPHLAFDATQVGCDRADITIPPAGPMGWPSDRALSAAPQATYYGALIALKLGSLDDYSSLIRAFNNDPTKPLYAPISSITGCATSPCKVLLQNGGDKGLSAMYAWETCLTTHRRPANPDLDQASQASDRNKFVGMFIDEMQSRCTGDASLHNDAVGFAESLPTASSTELLSAKAWILGKPIKDVAQSVTGMDVGLLERTVLLNWDYSDRSSAPALGL